MNREKAFEALSGLDDSFVSESLRYAPEAAADSPERIVHMKKKRIFTLALAAVLVLALSVTAYAVFFSMQHRVPEPEETFRITWEESPNGYIEWTDAKLAVTFPETAESREIEFRPGWLPEEMASLQSEGWLNRLTAETLAAHRSPDAPAAYAKLNQPLLIESYSMSMFNNGGAMLLLYYTPEDIHEEHWDEQGVDVMYFHATQHFDAVPEYNMPERTLEQNILLLSNADAGWVVRLAGEISMDEMLKVAQNLEIHETGRVLTYEDFDWHYTFFDGGVG